MLRHRYAATICRHTTTPLFFAVIDERYADITLLLRRRYCAIRCLYDAFAILMFTPLLIDGCRCLPPMSFSRRLQCLFASHFRHACPYTRADAATLLPHTLDTLADDAIFRCHTLRCCRRRYYAYAIISFWRYAIFHMLHFFTAGLSIAATLTLPAVTLDAIFDTLAAAFAAATYCYAMLICCFHDTL